MVDVNDFGSWPQAEGYGWHEEFRLWAYGSKCYEQLKIVDDMSYSESLAQGLGCLK